MTIVVAAVAVVCIINVIVMTGTDVILEDVVITPVASSTTACSLPRAVPTTLDTIQVTVIVTITVSIPGVPTAVFASTKSSLRVAVPVLPVAISVAVMLDALLQRVGTQPSRSSADNGRDEEVTLVVGAAAALVTTSLGSSLAGLARHQAANHSSQHANPKT